MCVYCGADFCTCQAYKCRKMSIGERLKEERERLGYTQEEFASFGEASKRSQIEWEKGKAFPNAKVLSALFEVGADVTYILTGVRTIAAQNIELSPAEEVLLDNFRHCEEGDQEAIRKMALRSAEAQHKEVAMKTGKKSKAA